MKYNIHLFALLIHNDIKKIKGKKKGPTLVFVPHMIEL